MYEEHICGIEYGRWYDLNGSGLPTFASSFSDSAIKLDDN